VLQAASLRLDFVLDLMVVFWLIRFSVMRRGMAKLSAQWPARKPRQPFDRLMHHVAYSAIRVHRTNGACIVALLTAS
jgi:hypothetical protein